MFEDIVSKVLSWMDSFNNGNEEDRNIIVEENTTAESHILSESANCMTDESDIEQTKITEGTSALTPIGSRKSDSNYTIKQNQASSILLSNISSTVTTVKETVLTLKESVGYGNILSEFNREQDQFIQNKQNEVASSLPPWAGQPNEHILKENCLTLSSDPRHFLCNPPPGIDFQFNYKTCYPVALAAMDQDPNLGQIRFELVPKVISEENFWRNYFYRVNLLCQANDEEIYKLSEKEQHSVNNLTVISENEAGM